MEEKEQNSNEPNYSIPMVSDAMQNIGDVKINHSVIANIALLTAKNVKGVLFVGKKGIVSGLNRFLFKKEPDDGVTVTEDAHGNYTIDICVTMAFGAELAKVASEIQQNVISNVTKMTMTGVNHVNVIIDGVAMPEEKNQ